MEIAQFRRCKKVPSKTFTVILVEWLISVTISENKRRSYEHAGTNVRAQYTCPTKEPILSFEDFWPIIVTVEPTLLLRRSIFCCIFFKFDYKFIGKKRSLTNYYIMHFKKKITVEELAGTCTSSSTIHGYLDELKRRNSISFEICPSINKKARVRATCSILRAYPDFHNMKWLGVVIPLPPPHLWMGY